MVTGSISCHRASLQLTISGPGGHQGEVEFVIDTGFTGELTLPRAACLALGLPPDRLQPSRLADGTRVMLEVFLATAIWDGAERTVKVLDMKGTPLLGMDLLEGHDVHLHVTDGGEVTIEAF